MRPRLLLIDNVDSFSFMLADYLKVEGADLLIRRNDEISVEEAMGQARDGVVVSPGPGRPEDAGISVSLARACVNAGRPYLGVCLGHQALALALGGEVERVGAVHGKTSAIDHDGAGLFAGLPNPLTVTRYHSLAVTAVPAQLQVQARSPDRLPMAMRHRDRPAYGVQFHPESVASEGGAALIRAFVSLCARA